MSHPSTQKTVWITGGAGFIGTHLAAHFKARGWRAVGFGRREAELRVYDEFRLVPQDLVELERLAPPAAVVHCAGSGSVALSEKDPQADLRASVQVAELFLGFLQGIRLPARFVFISSGSVYGEQGDRPCSESASLQPISVYGKHKKLGEELCLSYAEQVRVSVLRLFSVYGEGLRKQLLWDACSKLARSDAQFGGTGREIRDWIHVSDATELIWRAAQYEGKERLLLNGGAGVPVRIQEAIIWLGQCLGSSLQPVFDGRPRPGNPMSLLSDPSAAREKLGWVPSVNWKEGFERYARWFRALKR